MATSPSPVQGFFRFCCSSTSSQNSAAGFSLISVRVFMERRILASRSSLKSQPTATRGKSRSGVRLITFDFWQCRCFSGTPFKGDRSETFVCWQSSHTSDDIPFSGDKSDTCVLSHHRPCSGIPFKGDRSETFDSEHPICAIGIPLSGDRSVTGHPLNTRYSRDIPL